MPNNVLVCNHTGESFEYEVKVGLDRALVFSMQENWSHAKYEILRSLSDQYGELLDDEDFSLKIITDNNLADIGWEWDVKSFHCRSSEYIWFFLIADNNVQGACIIYHPKESRLDQQPIFYIDYIAAAYWNRDRPGFKKRFSGVGSRLISFVVNYAKTNLAYRYGFCLHSLPTAESYYRSLGMTEFEVDHEKEDLRYYEACAETAASIAGGAK